MTQPSSESATHGPQQDSLLASLAGEASLPGVFLMTDSFATGGSERQFVALSSSLDRSSFRLHLGCLQAVGEFMRGFENTPVFPLGGSLYTPESFKARWRLSKHLRRRGVAIAHAFDFYTNLSLIPAARMGRVPAVIGSHRQVGDLLTAAQFLAQGAVFRLCDRIVCNSHAAKQRLADHGISKSRLIVIGNGIPESAFLRAEPLLAPKPGVLRIGMVARMNARYKNHHVFLKAARRLAASYPHLEFVLVGDGPLRMELMRLTRELQISFRVHFLGDRQDIPSVLASLDVSVVPSASESLSNALLESMAAGVPVVASHVGGNPELVSDGRGLLVGANDEIALSAGLEQLLNDENLRLRVAERAREFARSKFAMKTIVTQYESLYREILEEKRWRPKRSSTQPGSCRRAIRVAIVAPSLRYVGGQAVQADILWRYWEKDPAVEIRFIPVDPAFPRWLKWAQAIPILRTIIREPIYLVALWRGLKDVDVAHLFSASYWSFLLAPAPALQVARLRRKRTLINYRSGEAGDHLRRFPRARAILAKADRLVVPSAYLVGVFQQFNLSAESVPNVADVERFSFRLRTHPRPHLVCTRGFHPYYRVDVVVRAFAEVQQKFPDARLDLVGQGPLEHEIRKLVAELALKEVNFLGVASREQIARFYDSADIFINASCLDNMPVSILEAFASGTPVVSTDPESIRHVVEHERTGLLSEVGDPRALAGNVIRLLQDADLSARIARNAYEECQRYSWARVREQWLAVYEALNQEQLRANGEFVSVA